MIRRHALTDDQCELIVDNLGKPARTGRPQADPRLVVDGIFWILRTGAPWRDLPERFGKWGTVYDLFRKWSLDKTLDQILR
jgi:transposase